MLTRTVSSPFKVIAAGGTALISLLPGRIVVSNRLSAVLLEEPV